MKGVYVTKWTAPITPRGDSPPAVDMDGVGGVGGEKMAWDTVWPRAKLPVEVSRVERASRSRVTRLHASFDEEEMVSNSVRMSQNAVCRTTLRRIKRAATNAKSTRR